MMCADQLRQAANEGRKLPGLLCRNLPEATKMENKARRRVCSCSAIERSEASTNILCFFLFTNVHECSVGCSLATSPHLKPSLSLSPSSHKVIHLLPRQCYDQMSGLNTKPYKTFFSGCIAYRPFRPSSNCVLYLCTNSMLYT